MKWLGKQIEWLKSFLSEPREEGEALKGSSKRLNMFLVILVFLIQYSKLTWENKELMDIPQTWAIVILCILGFGSYLAYLKNKNGSS